MRIKKAELFQVEMPLAFSFKTAATTENTRQSLILVLEDEEGHQGFGECVSFTTPFYTKETLLLSKLALLTELLPTVVKKDIVEPEDYAEVLMKKTPMAWAALENALWDVKARRERKTVLSYFTEEDRANTIETGLVFGIMPYEELYKKVETAIGDGCRRIKVKIAPLNQQGYSFAELVKSANRPLVGPFSLEKLVSSFPSCQFLVDGNSSFTIEDKEELSYYDTLGLVTIEEPFAYEDIEELKGIQASFKTPITMDESAQTFEDIVNIHEWNIGSMVNIKIGKLGGLAQAMKAISYCRNHGLQFWIGSMMESGVSKILHCQLATLQDCAMAGDLSSSSRYFEDDLIRPSIRFIEGKMKVPETVDWSLDREALEKYAKGHWIVDA